MIPRYSLDVTEVDHAIVASEQQVRKQSDGNIIFVNDLIKRLRELAESKSHTDRRRWVIESLIDELI